MDLGLYQMTGIQIKSQDGTRYQLSSGQGRLSCHFGFVKLIYILQLIIVCFHVLSVLLVHLLGIKVADKVADIVGAKLSFSIVPCKERMTDFTASIVFSLVNKLRTKQYPI